MTVSSLELSYPVEVYGSKNSVEVSGSEDTVEVSGSEDSVEVSGSEDSVEVSCSLVSSRPPAVISWYVNREVVTLHSTTTRTDNTDGTVDVIRYHCMDGVQSYFSFISSIQLAFNRQDFEVILSHIID